MNVLTLATNRLPRRRGKSESAFTLLEILVVIAILGLLVGLVVSKLTGTLENSSQDVAKLFVQTTLNNPLMQYRMHNSSFPTTDQGLGALITRPDGVGTWRGPYWEGGPIPNDPWGSPYQYAYPSTHGGLSPDVWSMGPDKTSGTADDIGNWPAATTEGK